jgi:glutamate carboxypeptidase
MHHQQLLEFFGHRQKEVLNLIRTLVDIESPSRDVQGSSAVADFLEREARKLKCVTTIERVAAENLGEHVILRAFENRAEKPLLLLGHTDTVHPRGSFNQNPTRVDGDKFYGCGIFDMKANCILMLEILRAFETLDLKPSKPITILLSCDEEIGSPTGRQAVEREAARAEFCLVCEPSAAGGKAKTGRKGTGNYKLKARGIPAHAGLEPENGASAILEIARQIPKIHELADYEKGTTVNVCVISGGTTTNVIPEFAECTIDVRFTSMTEARRIERELTDLLVTDARVSLQLSGEINRPPLERNEKTLGLYEKARRIADAMNYEFGETQVGGASDGNFVAALGVPVLDGLGVAGSGAHTSHEHVLIDDIARRATLLASLLTL